MQQRLKIDRIHWIDTLRAIAIVLVVLGHTPGIQNYQQAIKYIYSFHIPLFFFISGMLFNPKLTENKFLLLVRNQFWALMVPYFAWGLLTYLPWVIFSRKYGSYPDLDPFKPLLGLVYGTGSGTWLIHNSALWFLPCLFSTRVLFCLTLKYSGESMLPVTLVLFVTLGFVSAALMPFPLPWGFDIALVAIGFFGLGFLLRGRLLAVNAPGAGYLLGFLVLCFAAHLISFSYNERVSMGWRNYGNPLLFVLAAFLGIAFWFAVAKNMRPSVFLSKLGEASILIFVLHTFVFNLITGIAVFILKMPPTFRYGSLLVATVYTFIAVLLLLPAVRVVRRFQPWIIGR
jgi:fucose 4-O-acetylase-like acetyltransferase